MRGRCRSQAHIEAVYGEDGAASYLERLKKIKPAADDARRLLNAGLYALRRTECDATVSIWKNIAQSYCFFVEFSKKKLLNIRLWRFFKMHFC